MPYDWLTIECDAQDSSGCAARFLFDEKETGADNEYGNSVWCGIKGSEPVRITISVKEEYPDLALTSYDVKSACDFPERDPPAW